MWFFFGVFSVFLRGFRLVRLVYYSLFIIFYWILFYGFIWYYLVGSGVWFLSMFGRREEDGVVRRGGV